MDKKGLTLIILIIVLALVLIFLVLNRPSWTFSHQTPNNDVPGGTSNDSIGGYCTQDSDCVPSSCCHPNSCVVKSGAPSCSKIFCTQECAPGSLDCAQGSCGCVANKCQAVFK